MSSGGQHALLIGINKYPPIFNQLTGCLNDVERMRQFLQQKAGFGDQDFLFRRDEEATRAGILEGLDQLLQRTRTNDRVVFFFAGHGSRMRDREGTKASGYDETLVPHDATRGPFMSRDITDDELRLWLSKMAKKTSYITLIMDCCHSATKFRAAFGDGERGLPADHRLIAELPPSPIAPHERSAIESCSRNSAFLPAGDRYVLLAACRDNEKAREMWLQDQSQLFNCGAFTNYLLAALNSQGGHRTYREVFEQTVYAMEAAGYEQHAVCEGARDRAVFGIEELPTERYFLVRKVEGDRVFLDAGLSAGVLLGSQWSLFPPGTRDFAPGQGEPLRVLVVRAGPWHAEASIVSGTGPVAPLWRSVEVSHPVEVRWPIAVVGLAAPQQGAPSAALEQHIFSLIENSPWLRLAGTGEQAAVRVHLLPPRLSAGPDDPVPQLAQLPRPTWAAIGRDGELIIRPLQAYESVVLRDNLAKLARHRFIQTLENPGSRLAGRVRLQVSPLGGPPVDLDSVAVPSGTRMEVKLESLHKAPLYCQLLLLDAEAGVRLLYPPEGGIGELAAEHCCSLREDLDLQLHFPSAPSFALRADGTLPTVVTVYFLLIASAEPIDLSYLEQDTIRSRERGVAAAGESPMARLLREVLFGMRTDCTCPASLDPKHDWTTVGRVVKISSVPR